MPAETFASTKDQGRAGGEYFLNPPPSGVARAVPPPPSAEPVEVAGPMLNAGRKVRLPVRVLLPRLG